MLPKYLSNKYDRIKVLIVVLIPQVCVENSYDNLSWHSATSFHGIFMDNCKLDTAAM